MLTLVPMTPDELAAWLATGEREYIEQRIIAGEDPAQAKRTSDEQRGRLFPGGEPASGQYVYRLEADGNAVGMLWIGRILDGPADHWWLWNVEIDEPFRGRGLGRAAMLEAEAEARRHGATQLGLNVFAANGVARALYDSLGYALTSAQLLKPL